MDIHLGSVPASAAERSAVDQFLGRRSSDSGQVGLDLAGRFVVSGLPLSRSLRPLLLPGLWAIQERSGYISRSALDYLCLRLGVAPAEAFGVASAYAMFSFDESSANTVRHVCDDIACLASGGVPLSRKGNDADPQAAATQPSPCLGHCEFGSAALLQISGEDATRRTIAPVTNAAGSPNQDACAGAATSPLVPQMGDPTLRLLKRVGLVDPLSIDSYIARGGFVALGKALAMGAESVIDEVKAARLLGRGGAAFPTGVKWESVARKLEQPHYFVCNADESEPGTFKDRVMLENDPFAVVESLTVAGFATRCQQGYVYIRGEYPLAESRLRAAIESSREAGHLGTNIVGSGFDFDIEVVRGAGAYIAGEETALFNSIEGKRPEPRNKPPYPTDVGLFGKPTGANNVETLLNVLDIVRDGAETFRFTGTADSCGTRLFCLSGAVSRPGLYEVAMGASLRSVLEQAGAFQPEHEIRAVMLGGAAGVFVSPDQFDLELSFEGARAAGVTLGSGVVIVFDERTDFNAILQRIVRFFRDESCGQCVPCRVGTVRQEELVARLTSNKPLGSYSQEMELLGDLSMVMKDASICGLGQTASSALESAIRLGLFPDSSRNLPGNGAAE